MTYRPILFSAHMVRAILASRKTQTEVSVTEDELRSALADARAKALEEAAQVCDRHAARWGRDVTRCTRVEPWIYGWSWIKFADTPEPVKRPHLGYRHCEEDAVTTVERDGLTFHWCANHAGDPRP